MTTTAGRLSRSEITRWRNAIFYIFFMCGILFAGYMARVPRVRDVLGADTQLMGWLAMAISIGSIGGMTASSHVITKLGAKRTMLIFGTIMCLGITVAGIGAGLASIPVLALGLVLSGLGMGTTDVSMNVSAAANEQALGRTIMPLYHAVFSLGTMAGAGLGSIAEKLDVPIPLHLGSLTVLFAIGLWITNRLIQPEFSHHPDGEPPHSTVKSRLAVWTQLPTILIGLIVLGSALAEGSANDWLALAMVDGHGATNAQGALYLGFFLTAMTVGRVASVWLLDRFGRVPVLYGAAIMATIGLLSVIFLRNPVLVTVGILVWGLGASVGFPVGMSAAADDIRVAAARVSAVAMIGYLAFLVGPPFIGFLGHRVGLLHALLAVLVLVAIGGAVSSAAREPSRRRA